MLTKAAASLPSFIASAISDVPNLTITESVSPSRSMSVARHWSNPDEVQVAERWVHVGHLTNVPKNQAWAWEELFEVLLEKLWPKCKGQSVSNDVRNLRSHFITASGHWCGHETCWTLWENFSESCTYCSLSLFVCLCFSQHLLLLNVADSSGKLTEFPAQKVHALVAQVSPSANEA